MTNLVDWHVSHPWPAQARPLCDGGFDATDYAHFGSKLEQKVQSKIQKMIKREDITVRIMKIFRKSYF